MFIVILGWVLIGLVVGGLGRLVIPGRNPIGLILTVLIGIVGSVAGGAATRAMVGRGHGDLSFIVAVVIAAILVALINGSRRGQRRN
ncbi:MAG: GlsB/YeaQ/YmgE family stress response membrane protein [Streptosporangiaceae bacterium]